MIEDSGNTDTCPVQALVEHSAQHFGLVVDRPLNTRPKQPFTYCCGRTKSGRKHIEMLVSSRIENTNFLGTLIFRLLEDRHLTRDEKAHVRQAIERFNDAVAELRKIEFYETTK